ETLPHKEDWEFSLRLLAKYSVPLLEEALANFHYRADDYVFGHGNLVLDHGAHYAAETEVRNKFLRGDLTSGSAGLGFLTSLSFSKSTLFKEILSVGSVIEHVVNPQRRAKSAHEPQDSRNSEVHVAFAADERFAQPLATALRSLLENRNTNTFLNI